MKLLGFLLIFTALSAQANTLDATLAGYVKAFKLQPLSPPARKSTALFVLGRTLFTTRLLAGNKNIGCVDCHFPGAMTHDRLPLSLGEGATGVEVGGRTRTQDKGLILARNTPALFNLAGINSMFWDGRVEYDPRSRVFTTPVAALNGRNPLRKDITSVMKSALAAQAIFPIADHAEMRGQRGTNEIANAKNELEAWDLVVARLNADEKMKELLAAAFPNQKINIGHVGEALAEFQAVAFALADTAYDRYLKGDLQAMTDSQKKGMDVFFNKGKCGTCHQGKHLSMFEFESIGVPQIGPGKVNGDDKGRANWDPRAGAYTFRVPPLRNVGVTAPYMHNGSLKTLLDVVEHYDDVEGSLRNYNFANDWKNYVDDIANHNHAKDSVRLRSLAHDLQRKLNFKEDEEEALLDFLGNALTDKRLLNNRNPFL